MARLLRNRFAAAPRYQQALFMTHLVLRCLLILLTVVVMALWLASANPIPWFLVLMIPWGLYRQFHGWCIAYRSRRDPAWHYAQQDNEQGRATFEVLPDGRTVPSDAPLRADPYSIERATARGTSWHYDWLGAWLDARSPKAGKSERKLNTMFLSWLLVVLLRAAAIGVGFVLLAFFTLFGRALFFTTGTALVLLFVSVFLWQRVTRLKNYSSASFADGYLPTLSRADRFALYLWKLCSCERLDVGQFPTDRKRERRTLGRE